MKRDFGTMRDLARAMEAEPFGVVEVGPMTRKELVHLLLLADVGLVEECSADPWAFRLTLAGYDFVAATRDDAIWQEVLRRAGGELALWTFVLRILDGLPCAERDMK